MPRRERYIITAELVGVCGLLHILTENGGMEADTLDASGWSDCRNLTGVPDVAAGGRIFLVAPTEDTNTYGQRITSFHLHDAAKITSRTFIRFVINAIHQNAIGNEIANPPQLKTFCGRAAALAGFRHCFVTK